MPFPDPPIPPSAYWAPCAVCSAVVQDQQVHAQWHAYLDASLTALDARLAALEPE